MLPGLAPPTVGAEDGCNRRALARVDRRQARCIHDATYPATGGGTPRWRAYANVRGHLAFRAGAATTSVLSEGRQAHHRARRACAAARASRRYRAYTAARPRTHKHQLTSPHQHPARTERADVPLPRTRVHIAPTPNAPAPLRSGTTTTAPIFKLRALAAALCRPPPLACLPLPFTLQRRASGAALLPGHRADGGRTPHLHTRCPHPLRAATDEGGRA